MPASPRGHLTDDGHVVVPDQAEANRLFNKGFAGTPMRGGALRLTLIEATRLVEEDRLDVWPDAAAIGSGAPLRFRDLFELGLRAGDAFEIPLFAYRDLRGRGRVVKHANRRTLDFLVYAEGSAPPRDGPGWLVAARSERMPVTAAMLRASIQEAEAEGTALLLVVVDEDGDLTHYEVREETPSGSAPPFDATRAFEGRFAEDRVIVWDEEAASAFREPHFLGKRVPGGIQLSLVEAAALVKAGRLAVPDFWSRAEAVQPDLRLRTVCYEDLRKRGLWVKTGFKFGAHFRVYDKHPEEAHAPWLVHTILPDWESSWPEVSRAVRLAHSVRKTMLFSVVDAAEGRVRHLAVRRVRP